MWKGPSMLAFVCAFAFSASAYESNFATSDIVWVGTQDTWDLPIKRDPKPNCHSEIRQPMPDLYYFVRSVCDPPTSSDTFYATVRQTLTFPNPASGAHLDNDKLVFEQ